MKDKKKMGILLIVIGGVLAAILTGYGTWLINENNSESANENSDNQIKSEQNNTQKIIDSGKKNEDVILDALTPYSEKVNILWDIYQKEDKNSSLFQMQSQEELGLSKKELEEFLNEVTEKSKNLVEVAKAYMLKGDYKNAIISFKKALEFTARKKDIAFINSYLGYCYSNVVGGEKVAETFLQKAYEYYVQFVDYGSEKERYELSNIVNDIAIERKKNKAWAEAKKYHEQAISIRKKLADKNPNDYLFDLGVSYNNLGIILVKMRMEKFDIQNSTVDNVYQKALNAQMISLANDKNNIHKLNDLAAYAQTLNNIANWHSTNREFDLAEVEIRECLKIYEMADKRNPRLYKPYFALAQGNCANLLYSRFYHTGKGNITEIKSLFEKSIDSFEKTNLLNSPSNIRIFIGTLNNYQAVYAYENNREKINELNVKINDLRSRLN